VVSEVLGFGLKAIICTLFESAVSAYELKNEMMMK
jgi:hypothetical protein